MFVDLARSGIDLIRCMQCGGNLKNFLIMFDHIQCLFDWKTMGSYFGALCRDVYLQPHKNIAYKTSLLIIGIYLIYHQLNEAVRS